MLSTIEIQTNAQATVNSRIVFLNVDTKAVRLIESKQVLNQVDDELIDGFVYYHDMDGKFIVGYTVEQGQVTTRLTQPQPSKGKRSTKATSMFKSSCEEEFDLFNTSPCHGHLDEVIITATVATESSPTYYFLYDFGSGFAYSDYNIYGESFEDTQGGGGSNGDDNNSEEDRIDDSELAEKEKCLNEHLDKKGNSFVKDILSKFQGESQFDIKIISKNKVFKDGVTTGDGVNGKTKHVRGSSLINIEISTSNLSNMPALAAARTLIHEYIHADMFRKINTDNYDGDLDFKTTYEKYETEKQHNAMADLYVNSIRDALKDFHRNVLTGDYNYLTNNGRNPIPNSFYEALAWQGLKDANVKAYSSLSDSKKTELANALNKYYHITTKNCPN